MKFLKLTSRALLPVASLFVAGCFTVPNADVQPKGNPGLIQDGIVVESEKAFAAVESVDAAQRILVLKNSDGSTNTYSVAPEVKHFDQVVAGDRVRVTVAETLAIYMLQDGRLPDGSTAESLGVNARVLTMDSSYCLLTLKYPDGSTETFKVGLETKLMQIEPGDHVVVRPVKVTAIKIRKS